MKKLYQNFHYLVFSVFVVIQGLIISFIPLFGDDYYYAGFVKKGLSGFISENILHYKEVNGRVFVHLLDEILIGFGMWPWRIFNLAAVAIFVFFAAKLASGSYRRDADKERFARALPICCGLFCIIDMNILREGVYWATGSLNYIFPTCLSVVFLYFFRRDFEEMKGSFLLPPLAFLASVTTEQASLCALAVCGYFIISSFIIKHRTPKLSYIISLVASLLAFSSVFFSPGNSVRTTYYSDFYSLGLFGRIRQNAAEYFTVAFGKNGLYNLIIIFHIAVAVLMIRHYTEKKAIGRIFTIVYSVSVAALVPIYAYALETNSASSRNKLLIGTIAFLIILTIIYVIYRYFVEKSIDDGFLYAMAVLLQAVMLLTPLFGGRTLLISAVMLIIMIANRVSANGDSRALIICIAAIAFLYMPQNNITGLSGLCGAGVLLVLLSHNKDFIENNLAPAVLAAICLFYGFAAFRGYRDNFMVDIYNTEKISEYQESGAKEDTLTLAYMVNERYRYTEPYDNPYHMSVYKRLYDIPDGTEILYTYYTPAE